MADNYLPFQNPTATDAKLDTESLSVGANTVHRERIQIAGTGATDIAPVSATDGLLVNLGANNDVTVAGVATSAKQDTQITTLQLIDDVVHSEGGALGKVVALGAQLDDTGTTTASENAVSALRITAQRGLHINLRDNSGAELGVSGNEVYVRGTISIGNSPLVDTELPSSAVLADNTANPDTTSVGAFPHWYDGSTWDRARGDSTDGLLVNLGANNDVTVAGVSTLAEQQTQTTHLATIAGDTTNIETAVQLIDDVVYTDDTSTHATGTSKGVLMMAAAVPTDTAVNANDIGAVGMTANRELYVSLMTALPAGTNGIGKLTANSGVDIGDVDVTSVTPGTTASSLGKAEDAIHNTGDVGVMALAVSNEANTARAADGDYLPIATDTEGNVRVVGNRDHDAVDAGEVVGVGGRAIAHGANPTAVAAADRTAWYFNRAGVPFVMGGHPNIVNKHIQVTDADGAQTDVALVTVGAGSKIIVTRYSVTVDSATTATGGVAVRMGFGTANTPSNDANSGMLMAHSGIPAGGGIAEGDGSGIIGMGADNEDLRLTCEDPVGGNIDIVVSYYTIES